MIQQSHFWVYILKNLKQVLKEISAHQCSYIIHKSQDAEASQMPMDRRMNKIHKMEYYSALKRKFCHMLHGEP